MHCRVCDSRDLVLAIDLGPQPWCNNFLTADQVGKEPYYPLRVFFCNSCRTAQLDYTVPKEVMFGDHTYLSGVTKSLSAHFKRIADESLERFFPDRDRKSIAVLDVGSNDGTQLKHYLGHGCDVLGIESSTTTAGLANHSGVPTVNRFFNAELVAELGRTFQIINAAGVFFHLEELHSAAAGIKNALAADGIFIIQFLYMKRIVENHAFDQIYHEHLLYYNLRTIEALLERHGLETFDAYLAPIHGGSMIAFVTHRGRCPPSPRLGALRATEDIDGANELSTYLEFAKRIEVMKRENLFYLRQRKAEGKRIYGMGAPVKGNTLLNYFGVGTDYLDCLVEKNVLRDGLISPGMHIPVVMEDDKLVPPDVYYVLAWNFKKEILANNQKLIADGVEFFFPVNPTDDPPMNILVTGATGFMGTALYPLLEAAGHRTIKLSSRICDLTQQGALAAYSDIRFDQIFHLAAWTQAGDFCLHHPGEQWVINQQMNTNVLTWWQHAQPQAKLIFMGTSCSYAPDSPLVEESYLDGSPIESLFTYAMTKRMLYVGAMALAGQYGLKYLCLVPSTLYGEGYRADGRQLHFIFDLIRKIIRGKRFGEPVVLWGNGHQKRELVHVDDFVRLTLRLNAIADNGLINIGAGEELSIRQFAESICKIVDYDPALVQYDESKYVGATSKCLDVAKMRRLLPDFRMTPLDEGLRRTVNWFEGAKAY